MWQKERSNEKRWEKKRRKKGENMRKKEKRNNEKRWERKKEKTSKSWERKKERKKEKREKRKGEQICILKKSLVWKKENSL